MDERARAAAGGAFLVECWRMANHTMALENQALTREAEDRSLARMIDDAVAQAVKERDGEEAERNHLTQVHIQQQAEEIARLKKANEDLLVVSVGRLSDLAEKDEDIARLRAAVDNAHRELQDWMNSAEVFKAQAVRAERERCAKIAAEFERLYPQNYPDSSRDSSLLAHEGVGAQDNHERRVAYCCCGSGTPCLITAHQQEPLDQQ